MWCDDFDADLLKFVPNLADMLGDLAEVPLWTYGHETDGAINHPTCWATRHGFTAFAWLSPPSHKRDERRWLSFGDANYTTSDPLVRCTWLELLRDNWVHELALVVESKLVLHEHWSRDCLDLLMADLRGWRRLDVACRGATIGMVERAVRAATERLSAVICRDMDFDEDRCAACGSLAIEETTPGILRCAECGR